MSSCTLGIGISSLIFVLLVFSRCYLRCLFFFPQNALSLLKTKVLPSDDDHHSRTWDTLFVSFSSSRRIHSLCWRWRCFLSDDHQRVVSVTFFDDDHHSHSVGGSYFRLLYRTARFAFLRFFTHFSTHFFTCFSAYSLCHFCLAIEEVLSFRAVFVPFWVSHLALCSFFLMMFHLEVYIWVLEIVFLLFRY